MRGFHRCTSRTIVGHALVSACVFLLFLILNRPEVVLLSRLGMTAWYPAAGLVFAILLVFGPRYAPLFAVANAVASGLIYHQSLTSWGTLIGAPLELALYAGAAYLLRGSVKIDSSLSQRRDVLRYVLVTSAAAVLATLLGVFCLWADHTIQWNQIWRSSIAWYIGDTIGLLGVAPFLLIHVLPWVTIRLADSPQDTERFKGPRLKKTRGINPLQLLEFTGQIFAFVLLLWFMMGGLPSRQVFYLAFLPIIWIAMRQGIQGAVSGLLVLNFGIVASLRFISVSPEVFTRLGFMMLSVSATGLILGSAVSERHRIAKNLEERTTFLNSLIDNSPFGIVVQNQEGKIQLFNDAFANLFHYSSSEIIGHDLDELIVPDESRAETAQLKQAVSSGQTVHKTVRRRRKDGNRVDVEVHVLPMVQEGRVHGGYVIYKDISEQVKAAVAAKEHAEAVNRWVGELEQRTMQITLLNEMAGLLQCAESSEEAYAVVAQSAKKLLAGTRSGSLFVHKSSRQSLESAATWGDSPAGEPLFAPSECWSLRLGQSHWSECPGQHIVCAHVDNSIAASYLCIPLVAQGETMGVLHLRCDPDGSSGDAEADQKARESQKRLAVAAASQIALSLSNLRLRETLRDQSIRDPLTGLFNRRFMQESLDKELQRAIRKERSLAVLFLDLDHFKHFNDVFGHDAGDSVLRSMADIFRLHFRAEDVICRYGGEEFAIILPESSIQDAAKRAESLRTATRELKLVHGGVLLDPVTLSIGIAGFPEHAATTQRLMNGADKALYLSKANGRDRVSIATFEQPAILSRS